MIKLLFITDFTESFAYALLRGIIRYSKQTQQWVVCRMPPSFKKDNGMEYVVNWAKKWGADVVIGQFDPEDDVMLFRKNGIIAIAQDYKKKFDCIPNITADYSGTGEMAASLFIERQFRNFGFFGYKDVCWSDQRCEGFLRKLQSENLDANFFFYNLQEIDSMWHYDEKKLRSWLFSLPKPIAIFACDDNQGNMLIDACNSFGIKIPGEISVIGVDNDEVICNLTNPTLTSIYVDIEQGGFETARMAEEMINGKCPKGYDIVLHPKKIVRRVSSAAFASTDYEILDALQFIQHNIKRKLTVSDIVKEVPLSRRLLEIRFRKVTGESIYQYISKQRIAYFADKLLDTNDSIQDIALDMGEDDSKNLIRRFKAVKGCTPKDWRNKYAQIEN